jgi:predicted metal-binding protein
MSKESQYDAHLFVCTNTKDGKPSCGPKGGMELRDKLKASCKKEPWSKRVRVNGAGCLGRCEEGITAVLYPKGKWFTHLTKEDEEQLKNVLIETLGEEAK